MSPCSRVAENDNSTSRGLGQKGGPSISLSRRGQIHMAPPAIEQVFTDGGRSVAAAEVADATAAAARSTATATDAGNAAAPAAGTAAAGRTTRHAAASAARAPAAGGTARGSAAATRRCGRRDAGRGSGGGRWRRAAAGRPLVAAAASDGQHKHGRTAQERDGIPGSRSHQLPQSPLAPLSAVHFSVPRRGAPQTGRNVAEQRGRRMRGCAGSNSMRRPGWVGVLAALAGNAGGQVPGSMPAWRAAAYRGGAAESDGHSGESVNPRPQINPIN